MFETLAAILRFALVASPVLAVRAILSRSWVLMWFAALGSFAISIIGMFSIGAFVFVLTCVQLAALIAMRWRFSPSLTAATLLLSLAIWTLLVPVQIAGYRWGLGLGTYQIVGMLALIVVALPWEKPRRAAPAR